MGPPKCSVLKRRPAFLVDISHCNVCAILLPTLLCHPAFSFGWHRQFYPLGPPGHILSAPPYSAFVICGLVSSFLCESLIDLPSQTVSSFVRYGFLVTKAGTPHSTSDEGSFRWTYISEWGAFVFHENNIKIQDNIQINHKDYYFSCILLQSKRIIKLKHYRLSKPEGFLSFRKERSIAQE